MHVFDAIMAGVDETLPIPERSRALLISTVDFCPKYTECCITTLSLFLQSPTQQR